MEQLAISQITEAHAAARAGCPDARRRLARLLDEDSLVEYGPLAGRTSNVDDDGPADGLVGGVGELDGHPVVAASYDRSVAGGTQSDRNQRKLGKLIHLAHTNRWPLVVVVDGDGARPGDHLPLPPIVVYTRGRFDVYDGLAELSGWAPTVAVLTGRALDGHAGLAFLCDLVIGVRGATVGGRSGSGPASRAVPGSSPASGSSSAPSRSWPAGARSTCSPRTRTPPWSSPAATCASGSTTRRPTPPRWGRERATRPSGRSFPTTAAGPTTCAA